MILSKHVAWPVAFAVSVALAGPSIAEQPKDSGALQTPMLAQASEEAPKITTGSAEVATTKVENSPCASAYSCIGMVIDSGDPILVQMGHEMSDMVTDRRAGTVVQPTEGPIANVLKMLSRENAGLSVVPSDMLLYTARSEDPRMKLAEKRLRFIMSIGRKVVHVIAKKDIQSLRDLDGKRVVMGPDNTALWVVSNNLLSLHDATPSRRLQMKPPAGIKALLADEADAAFVVGDLPMKPVQKLAEMLQSPEHADKAELIHILEIEVPAEVTEYQPATLDYPGLAEGLKTVAILPTLISYDFTHKSSPYFTRRCSELTRIGETVRARLEELRGSGHKQWNATKWELEAGNWKQDACFFADAAAQIAKTSKPSAGSSPQGVGANLVIVRADVREAQKILNTLGYNVGDPDGILGPKTSAGLRKFQSDLSMTPNGEFSSELLEILKAQEEAMQPAPTYTLGSS